MASLVAEGIEFFAATDHDYLTDYEPIIDALELGAWIDASSGSSRPRPSGATSTRTRWTSMPTAPSTGRRTGSAVEGLNLPPTSSSTEREHGARVVQVNHPRTLDFDSTRPSSTWSP